MIDDPLSAKTRRLEKENEDLRALVDILRTWQSGFEKKIRELRAQGTSSPSVDDVD